MKNDDFLGMIKGNLSKLREVALVNPFAAVINSSGAHLAEFHRDGTVILFPGISALTYLSLTIMQRIFAGSAIIMQNICDAINANGNLKSFHLKYTNDAVSDATNAALIQSLPIKSLTTATFIDASHKIHRIYGFDRSKKLVETTDVSLIGSHAIEVGHLRVINLETTADLISLMNILNRNDVVELKRLYISGTKAAIMQQPLHCLSSIPDVTIQIHEIDMERPPEYRKKRDVLVKRGTVYDFDVHTDAFCTLPPNILAHMESACLHFPEADQSLFEAYASLLLPLTNLKELDSRRDNGFMPVFIEAIFQSDIVDSELLPALRTVFVGLSAVPALSNRLFQLYDLKGLKRIYVRYDVVTNDALANLESLKRKIKRKNVDYVIDYERILDRVLFQKNE